MMIPAEISIGDVLRLSLPSNTQLGGKADQARRSVDWVVIITQWDDLPEQVQTGDLVIIPAHLQTAVGESQFKQYLRQFATQHVTGLILFAPISLELNSNAYDLNLPLLLVSAETTPRTVHQDIVGLLHDRQTATAQRTMQLYRQLAEMSREGQGLRAMTDVMAKQTGKIVVVQDKRLDIQAKSGINNDSIDSKLLEKSLTNREELPPILRNRKAAAKARQQSYWQAIESIDNYARLVSPIISGDRARGYLSIVGPADELDQLDNLVAEYGAAACALEMAKAKAVSEAKKELRGSFLEGLLNGSMSAQEIERLEGRLDHDTKQPHMIITLNWANADAPSLRRLETTINWLLTNHTRAALVYIYGGRHVCIFQALKSSDDTESVHTLTRRIREQIEAEYPNAKITGGISGPALALTDWPRVYSEALQAMQLGQRLRLINQVVEYSSLGIYNLLRDLEDHDSVKKFNQQVIGPLVAYDEQHKGSLIETIDAYFVHHGNVSKTAEALYVHRNTLLYRLERIQELTGHDLDRAEMRLALHLALKFWQLRPKG